MLHRATCSALAAGCLVFSSCASKEPEHPDVASASATASGSAAPVASGSASPAASGSVAPLASGSAAAAGSAAASGSAAAAGSAAASGSASPEPGEWTYGGKTGPVFWGDLSKAWAICRDGKQQSPIDVPSKTEAAKAQPRLAIDYLPIPLHIKNNGRTIQIDNVGNNYITIGKKRYELIQLHFHSPSEHTIAGQRYDMEMHLVHKAADKTLAVVAVLFKSGDASDALKVVWKKMPKQVNAEPTIVKNKSVDLSSLLSLREGYDFYQGSLTTPPCSEGVSWYLLKIGRAHV
jgi:carbonic anhydrase